MNGERREGVEIVGGGREKRRDRGSVVNGVNTRQRRRRKEDTGGLRMSPQLFVY
jgi:hypothetical protein